MTQRPHEPPMADPLAYFLTWATLSARRVSEGERRDDLDYSEEEARLGERRSHRAR
jgi:hypothetical protein